MPATMTIPLNVVKETMGRYNDFYAYSNFKLIGVGGSAKVYSVQRKDRLYAMKIPIIFDPLSEKTVCDINEDIKDEFESEVEYLAELSNKCSDSVVNLEDFGLSPMPWLVMELAERDLRKMMKDGKVKIEDVIEILDKLDSIHRSGFYHLDIKPENIMKVGMQWKFTDFGLSDPINSVSKSLSKTGYTGTYMYSAPEQFSPKKFGNKDHRTDIWQMAEVCYEILAGRDPYDTDDIMEMADLIREGGPNLDYVPEQYRSALSKAFCVDKKDRYQSASEFADAIRQLSTINTDDERPDINAGKTQTHSYEEDYWMDWDIGKPIDTLIDGYEGLLMDHPQSRYIRTMLSDLGGLKEYLGEMKKYGTMQPSDAYNYGVDLKIWTTTHFYGWMDEKVMSQRPLDFKNISFIYDTPRGTDEDTSFGYAACIYILFEAIYTKKMFGDTSISIIVPSRLIGDDNRFVMKARSLNINVYCSCNDLLPSYDGRYIYFEEEGQLIEKPVDIIVLSQMPNDPTYLS